MPGQEGPDPDAVAQTVLAVPGVAGLHGGLFGEVATYLPRRRVAGVRITPEAIDVHVVVTPTAPVRAIAADVRAAVAALVPGVPVDVTVEDVATDAGNETPGSTGTSNLDPVPTIRTPGGSS